MKTMIFSSLRLASLRSPMTALGLALGMSLSVLLAACGGGGGGNASTNGGNSASGGAATVGISATPTTTTVGQLITLNWTSTNASSCTASGAWSGAVATSGSQAVTAGAVGAASYTLTCGGVSSTANVTINAAPAAPVVSVVLTPASATPGQSSQLSWSATNATSCTAAGAWTGNQATSGTLAVSQSAVGTYTYTLNCSGTGGSASGSANLAVANPTGSGGNNTATVVVDSGPSGLDNSVNEPYVSVTVCRPGTTVCQTIDHVLVDTGSYGLRLLGPLNSALALPAVNTPSGAAAGECVKFADGYYTWGSVQQADVRIGGETAPAISLQVIGDSSSNFANVPSTCTSAGGNMGSVSTLGANGILGVGLFKQDCGNTCLRSNTTGNYYACANGSCTDSPMALAQQVSNPVSFFTTDNNGVLLMLPSVPDSGATTLTGTLIFGVNTQSNNSIASETIYRTDSSGNFSTRYKNATYGSSFIDSGSNGLFFSDSSLRNCSQSNDFYCPASPISLSAVNTAADGSASGTVNFVIVSEQALDDSVTAALIGGSTGSTLTGAFDWGLPFFFGRRVFVVIENNSTGGATGPYWAY